MAAVYVGIVKVSNGPGGPPLPVTLANYNAPDKSPRALDVLGVLAKTPTQFPTRLTHSTERFLFHILVDVQGSVESSVSFIFVCVAEPSVEKAQAYELLEKLQRGFISNQQFMDTAMSPSISGNDMQADLEPFILRSMAESGFGKPDKLSKLKDQVTQVKQQMASNVERVLERGDHLDELMDRSADLESSSSQFRVSARRVQRAMCCKNLKWTIALVCFIVIFIAAIVLVILFKTGAFSGGGKSVTTTSAPPKPKLTTTTIASFLN